MAEAGKEDYARMWTGWNSLTVWMPRRMTRVFPGGMLIMSECETAGGGRELQQVKHHGGGQGPLGGSG